MKRAAWILFASASLAFPALAIEGSPTPAPGPAVGQQPGQVQTPEKQMPKVIVVKAKVTKPGEETEAVVIPVNTEIKVINEQTAQAVNQAAQQQHEAEMPIGKPEAQAQQPELISQLFSVLDYVGQPSGMTDARFHRWHHYGTWRNYNWYGYGYSPYYGYSGYPYTYAGYGYYYGGYYYPYTHYGYYYSSYPYNYYYYYNPYYPW